MHRADEKSDKAARGQLKRFSKWMVLPLAVLILCSPLATAAREPGFQEFQQAESPSLEKLLSLAYGHHELAILLLKEGEPEKASDEARKILQLHIPPKYEISAAQSLSIISEKLADLNRFDLAQSLLDEAFEAFTETPDRVIVLRDKARLYVKAGENDKAIDAWQKALDLESSMTP